MSEHPTVDLLRRGYEAFAKGDLAGLDAVFADDIVWHLTGRNPLAGDHHGKEAVFTRFGEIAELTGGTFAHDIHDILGNDRHGAVITTVTGIRGDRTLRAEHVDVFRIADGRIAEFWSTGADPYAEDEFWA